MKLVHLYPTIKMMHGPINIRLAVLLVFMLTDEFCVKFCKILVLYLINYSRKFLDYRRIVIRFSIADRHISRSVSSGGRQGASGDHPIS